MLGLPVLSARYYGRDNGGGLDKRVHSIDGNMLRRIRKQWFIGTVREEGFEIVLR
jgi:hypothetical protein